MGVSPKKKSQLMSPKKSNPQGSDADSESSTEEEASPKVSLKKADNVQKKIQSESSSSSFSSEDESQDKAKPSSDQKNKEDKKDKKENKSDDKSKRSLCATSMDKETSEKDDEVKVPENSNTEVPERPSTPSKSKLPEGFTVLRHASKKGAGKRTALKIEGPNKKVFYTYKAVHEFVESNPNYLEASPSKNSSTKMSTENVKGKEEKQSKDIRKPKWMSGESSSGLKAGVETSDKNDAPFKSTNDSSTRAKTSSDGDKNVHVRKESESKVTPVKSSSSSDTDSS